MNTADMQKSAFDTVEKSMPISASQIAALVRDFTIAEGKLLLVTSVDMVAEKLMDLGVETCGDLRLVTFSEYAELTSVASNLLTPGAW